uniref:Uncharacterized protein n=1 Tax=Arundo donax TaxID=35708 RepID=A0A0A9HHF6_ARUDO
MFCYANSGSTYDSCNTKSVLFLYLLIIMCY